LAQGIVAQVVRPRCQLHPEAVVAMAAFDATAFADSVKQAAPMDILGIEGWHEFSHPGGSFEVCLRPGGVFFCPTYHAASRWCNKPGSSVIAIAWEQYGCYELEVTSQSPFKLAGSIVGSPADWRKMEPRRALSAAETKLLGVRGTGTQWKFSYNGGEFDVQFRADSYNHFICQTYPALAHWNLGGDNADELTIDWGKFGTYELRLNGAAGSGEGSLKGSPTDWRRMTYICDLPPAVAGEKCAHGVDIGSSCCT